MSIPITPGTGGASVAAEAVSGLQYQRVEVTGLGGASILAVDANGAITTNTVIIGGSIATTAAANQSVSGTVGASVIGWVPVQVANASIISYVPNSVAAVIIGGSIAATVTPAANQSVSGTVGASVVGHAPVVIVGGSIAASFTPPANQSVSGTVGVTGSVAALQGTNPWTVVSSLAGGIFPVSGSVAATITNANVNVSGSVVAFLGTNPWPVVNVGSIISLSSGSIIAVVQAASIAGTYAEDVAHTPADRGIYTLAQRNDTLASVTSADGDYSGMAVGPAGENIVADAPFTKWVSGISDLRVVQGASVTAIAAQGASVFTYVREVQVANFGPSSVLVKIAGGLGSTLGWTIAPAGGGSNFTTRYKTGENSAVTTSISGTASVLVTISGFTARI